jgi:hypothetical protein
LSALTQQTALLLPVPVAVAVLAGRRAHLKDGCFWWGAALFALPPSLWFVAKTAFFGTPGDVVTRHWGLLGLAPESLPFYLGSLLDWLGWPWLAVLVVGTVLWFRGSRRREALLLFSAAAVFLLFFALFYRWQASRFLVYSVIFFGFPVAEVLVRIKRPIWRLLVWAAILLGFAVSPGIHVPYNVVLRERVSSWPPAPDPSLVRADDSAIVVHGGGQHPDSLRELLLQSGNALERRVRLVPEEVLPDHWWGWSTLTPLGGPGFFQLWRITLPGGLGTAAVVRRDCRQVDPEELLDGLPEEKEIRQAVEWCRSVDALLEFDDDHLAVVLPPSGEAPTWLQLLPFVTETTSFYVLDAESGADILRSSPVEDRLSIGDLEATRLTYLSRRAWVVRETGGSGPMRRP